ncbi:MAG: hypothetical protein KKG60_03150 [Nanoarchaeota archaeon]|nr:hypothetical protein [Nanoarchaeota archaeon]
MITIEEQQSLLLNISNKLKKRITIYAIGGTAMMFLGLKDATLDIDLVFDTEKERETFINTAKDLGYIKADPIKIYGKKKNQPEMLTLGEHRFDLFLSEVIHFYFSEDMKKRAVRIYEIGKNLILKIADPQDILLMKCATDRMKDKDDAKSIIEETKINWEILIDEAKNQVKLGKERALFDLGIFLDDLKKAKIKIPAKVLDEIYKLVNAQIKRKSNRQIFILKSLK